MKKERLDVFPFRKSMHKIIRVMKLVSFFLLAGFIQASANVYSQTANIKLSMYKVALSDVIREVQQQTEFTFFYSPDDIKDVTVEAVELERASLEKVLDYCLKGTDLKYEIVHKAVILRKSEEKTKPGVLPKLPPVEQPQKKQIKGKVTDGKGDAVPGTTVFVKGTSVGTITDFDGNFSLDIPLDAKILTISFVGMKTQEIEIRNQTSFNIVMIEETVGVEEVVVVGYGMQKKESVVGAISQTSGDQLKQMNTTEISNSLTGLVPGLVTIQQSGVPGGFNSSSNGRYDNKTQIFIRGLSTWNGGEPLILVDGVERSLDDLDANEIEGLSVLKDASATAVFGVRGANGVILITSKRGKIAKPKITFEGQMTTSMISKMAKTLDSYQANLLKNYAILNEVALDENAWKSYVPYEKLNYYRTQEYPEIFPDVDWADIMLKDAAKSYKFSTNVTGGTKFVKYFGSLSYIHEGGILDGKDEGQGYESNFSYDRFSFRSNLDFQFTKSTKLSINLAGFYASQRDPGGSGNTWRTWSGVYSFPPDLYPVKYSDGYYAENPAFDKYPNPYIQLNFSGLSGNSRSQINTDIKFEQKLDFITKGLSAAVDVSVDNSLSSDGPYIYGSQMITKYIDPRIIDATSAADSAMYNNFTEPTTTNGYGYVQPLPSRGNEVFGSVARQLFYQASIRYDRQFGKHSVTALALVNRTENASGSSFLHKREDWVGRVTYDFDSRYFLEVNAGYNGSEKFDRKYRFGLFPSIAGGWMISNERFFKDALPWWSTAKIRYSNGMVGSDQGIDPWLYVENWNKSSNEFNLSAPYPASTGYPVSREGAVSSPNAHWETAVKQNLGIETGFLDNKLRMNLEIFKDDRKDMLIEGSKRANNGIFGATMPAANLGRTKTSGYEIELQYNHRTSSGLGINVKYNLGYAKDKIIFRDDPQLLPDYQKQAGYPIGQTRTFVNTSIIQSWDQLYTGVMDASNAGRLPGDFRRLDFNADGVVDDNDVVPYQYPKRPQYNYSLSLGFNYKGFSLSTLFYGVFNVSYVENYYRVLDYQYSIAYPWHMDESWLPETGNTLSAQRSAIRFSTPYEFGYSTTEAGSYDVVDGSSLRLKNIELAYQFNEKILKFLGIGSLRAYISGHNLLYWSKLREDREGSPVSEGQTIGTYPLMKSFTLGVNVGL